MQYNRNSPGTWQLLDRQCKQEVPLASSKPHVMPVQPETSREGVIDSRTTTKDVCDTGKKTVTFNKTSFNKMHTLAFAPSKIKSLPPAKVKPTTPNPFSSLLM